MADFLPRSPETLTGWLERFNVYLNANYLRLGLTADDLQVVDLLNLGWAAKQNAQVAAKTTYRATTDERNNEQVHVSEVIRPLVKRIQACPATTDTDRESLGITVYSRDNTTSDLSLGITGSRPLLTIDTHERLQHKMKVQSQTSDGVKYGKPAGAIGCEIFRKIGDPPASDAELEMVGVATRSTYTITYPLESGGQQVHYMTRWVNSKGEKGPWSETESATIAA